MQIGPTMQMTEGQFQCYVSFLAIILCHGVPRNNRLLLSLLLKLSTGVQLLLSWRFFCCNLYLKNYKSQLQPSHLFFCDNLSAFLLSKNPILHQRTKHLELDLHFVREKVTSGYLNIAHVPSIHQWTDLLTKSLSYPRFSHLRAKLRVIE